MKVESRSWKLKEWRRGRNSLRGRPDHRIGQEESSSSDPCVRCGMFLYAPLRTFIVLTLLKVDIMVLVLYFVLIFSNPIDWFKLKSWLLLGREFESPALNHTWKASHLSQNRNFLHLTIWIDFRQKSKCWIKSSHLILFSSPSTVVTCIQPVLQ